MDIMKKRNLTIKILRIIATIFLVVQIFSYIGVLTAHSEPLTEPAEIAGYYFGLNTFLLISLILFVIAYRLQKKLKKSTQVDLIDSIGKPE